MVVETSTIEFPEFIINEAEDAERLLTHVLCISDIPEQNTFLVAKTESSIHSSIQ
jgi:hypothetical protein